MNIFLTGAAGYIGGAIGARLTAEGHAVRGLVRNPDHAPFLREAGVVPVQGDLDDAGLLAAEAERADGVVNAANSDHRGAAEALLRGLRGSGKPLVHTSGTSLIGDDARGLALSPHVFDDADEVVADSHPVRQARFALDMDVVAADGVRGVVLCNSLIYGTGRQPNPDTVLLTPLVEQARASGVVRVVGTGANTWSTVHLDDMAALYSLVLTDPSAAGFYFVENGESSFAEIGAAVADRLGLGPVQPWPLADAAAAWGEGKARYALGANSRVRATRARELGWKPSHGSMPDWVRQDLVVR
ncbi:Nucleoside-diphosphate-sugar epimerase [Lentzea fradiae]|uniref:Nucleoside-diphosphate-sugar epimerase n=1 Tax=Lentzea fradiae TaxID=200378 RepID=A0A1G7KMU3_9PSEU|nr:NAD-dependent epimerase/dehydratase family protein [Lentzea fradiae]SDF38354.1 Nucleoside-diphosphate-sugar epimerase [Lentzea fradiae]